MSREHPIVAITGSSGAGTSTVQHAFSDIFRREGINAAFVHGGGFRRYDRNEMKRAVQESIARGTPISHFGPHANLFDRLEGLFRDYAQTGTGQYRRYLARDEDGQEAGSFTPWMEVEPSADLLFYEGLHGGVVVPGPDDAPGTGDGAAAQVVDVARWVDLLIGVTPIVNLEWIQKIHRDTTQKGSVPERITATILRRMPDYINYIVPQFSRTHINFQRVPLVDTSNPFIARDIPTLNESVIVVRFREPRKHDFPHFLRHIDGAFMSRPNTMVVPGGMMMHAMEIICAPIIHRMLEQRLQKA